LKGHKSTIHQVQFSLDGKTLLTASAGSERSIHFWNVASGQEILVLKDLTAIESALFGDAAVRFLPLLSPDGDTLAWADRAPNARFTAVPTLAQLDQQIQTQTRTRPTAALSREPPGELDEALKHYSGLLQQQPKDPRLWQVLGMLLVTTNRFEEAIQAYTRALEVSGTNADHVRIRRQVLLQRSDIFRRLNRPAESVADCRTLLETCRLSAAESSSLALKYCEGPAEQRDLERAQLFLQHAARLPLSNSTALAGLGKAYYRVGQFSNAVERVLESARLGEGLRARHSFILCLSYQKLGQTDKARDCYERGLADLKAGAAQGRYLLADINYYKQMQSEAEQTLGLSQSK
jgi:tetratricopeptide (TPR) repeat protein